ncbi:hypothetical protein BU002_02210 [Mammaliicoccus sciuri]|uniref:hypothetical protein n=1 Tax=Mammaliicoccus sciuri TaxID=1296 RepID=UPI000E693C27|nr:hypothetical protein [Mammaliicoccus sciuri]RIN97154.1 hypothetical protein BU002_02210 [Mammaliicoccus sciuri]
MNSPIIYLVSSNNGSVPDTDDFKNVIEEIEHTDVIKDKIKECIWYDLELDKALIDTKWSYRTWKPNEVIVSSNHYDVEEVNSCFSKMIITKDHLKTYLKEQNQKRKRYAPIREKALNGIRLSTDELFFMAEYEDSQIGGPAFVIIELDDNNIYTPMEVKKLEDIMEFLFESNNLETHNAVFYVSLKHVGDYHF